ncbi:hypothetical protein MKK75_00190 [Methylobacterium sp. J-030]|uniref:hypothetical protein n=1 Tax=Methylobacterium sp. J-030 TaxID=2836627 RepID=UPI001FBAC80C|nr:hypothetical protein [Methylobacterium sp. J-030]MCJ2067240.1 hypothetical protein [Methylobacterium sp. J-030]
MAQQTITALYDRYGDARAAVGEIEGSGIPHGDIGLVSSDAGDRHAGAFGEGGGADTRDRAEDDAKDSITDSTKDGTGAGATLGTVAGAAVGLLAGLGLIAIPGVGPVVAAGWLVATLTGAGIGAAAGGLAGALTGAGVSEGDAQAYGEGVRRGGTLVTIRIDPARAALAPTVTAILERHGAVDLDQKASAWRTEGWTGPQAMPGTGSAGAPGGRGRTRAYPATDDL